MRQFAIVALGIWLATAAAAQAQGLGGGHKKSPGVGSFASPYGLSTVDAPSPRPHKPQAGLEPLKPIGSMDSLDGGKAFKPFKGTSIYSGPGAFKPYKPAKPKNYFDN